MSRDNQTLEVLLFAGLKHRLGRSVVQIELPAPITVASLLAGLASTFPEIAPQLGQCRVAVNQAFADPTDPVPPGSEIALIPPVSGGHDGEGRGQEFSDGRCVLTSHSLTSAPVVAAVEHAGAGGLVTFTGNVRRKSRGKTIDHLEYEGYGPMAVATMARITREIEACVAESRVAIHHRVGRLEVGEAAVIIAASAPHRAEAFEACRLAIEALKRDVPIWKKEVATDGVEWIGQGP